MRSRWLLILGASVLASASCATGSEFTGVGGLGGLGGQPSDTTSTSGHSSSSDSSNASTGAGAGGNTTSSTTSGPSPTSSTSGAGGSCPASPCKLTVPQCGCPTGEECGLSGGAVACVSEGFGALGQQCGSSASDQCGPGMACVGIAPAGTVGQCDAFCDFDSECAPPGGLCLITLLDSTGTGSIPGVTLCTTNCDPAAATNSGCPTGTGCQLLQETAGQMRSLTDCRSAGTKGYMATCNPDLSECAPGYGCANTGTSDVCLKYCKVAAPSCPAGLSCAFIGTLGTTDYGLCL